MFNQITLLGYLGKDATSSNKGGTIVTKFSVATKKSWKDQNDEWQEKSQWHQVVCFGPTYEAMTSRLVKGAQVFVQGQLSTHDYERTIKVPAGGKKSSSTSSNSSSSKSKSIPSASSIVRPIPITTPPSRNPRRPRKGLRPFSLGVAPRSQPQAQRVLLPLKTQHRFYQEKKSFLAAGRTILAAGQG